MNCTVCGNALVFDRVVFHCSCGAFIHAYCWDNHVLQAHQPSFEKGSVDIYGEFKVRETKIMKQTSEEHILNNMESQEENIDDKNLEE